MAQTWEYTNIRNVDDPDLERANALGAEGWEAVGTTADHWKDTDNTPHVTYTTLFKRPTS